MKHNKVSVDIDRNGRQTIARSFVSIHGKRFEAMGATVLNEHDKDKPRIGDMLSVAESLRNLARKVKQDAWKSIRPEDQNAFHGYSDNELQELADAVSQEKKVRAVKAKLREKIAAEQRAKNGVE